MVNLFLKKTSPPILLLLLLLIPDQLGRIIAPTTHRGQTAWDFDPQPLTEYTLTSPQHRSSKKRMEIGGGGLLKKSHFSQVFLSRFFWGGKLAKFAASLFGPKHLLKRQINLFVYRFGDNDWVNPILLLRFFAQNNFSQSSRSQLGFFIHPPPSFTWSTDMTST